MSSWRPWQRRSSSPQEGLVENQCARGDFPQDTANESTSLLAIRTSPSSPDISDLSDDSEVVDSLLLLSNDGRAPPVSATDDPQQQLSAVRDFNQSTTIPLETQHNAKKRCLAARFAPGLFAAFLFLVAFYQTDKFKNADNKLRLREAFSGGNKLLLSNPALVYAPDVADESTSIGELAGSMLPSWYELSVSKIPVVITSSVMPSQVYKTRKIVLKTRDLLDVFSPVYPNNTGGANGDGDMWESIRNMLDRGYEVVGDFQDLAFAHVRYSAEQLDDRRKAVLDWKGDFMEFQRAHNNDIIAFLSSPSLDGSSFRHRESRLFWKSLHRRPRGDDPATTCLQLLGSRQLKRSLKYLRRSYPFDSVLNNSVHEEFHSLRKELRSLTDEFELFSWVMYPLNADTFSHISVLKSARHLLGDMNDDWVAYNIYVENDMYHMEQARLAERIHTAWESFKLWIEEIEFESVIQSVAHTMHYTLTLPNLHAKGTQTLPEFLEERKLRPTRHFVIGNEAGDADTIISAISLAYLESTMDIKDSKTPIVALPKVDFETQRPEVTSLLELAGVVDASGSLIFVDDPLVEDETRAVDVTLVDHNVLAENLRKKNWKVVEIVDHHRDEGQYLNTCSGVARNIAFSQDKALVASACTLVAEELKEVWKAPYPASLGVLLLGVILLDSVNLSPDVGKVTQRDRDAVVDLLEHTDWQSLSEKSRKKLNVTSLSGKPNTNTFFDMLQDTKYDPRFWASLSTRDALQLDYKEYGEGKGLSFGVSTVLMPARGFLSKPDLNAGIGEYLTDSGFLAIMFAFEGDQTDNFGRQLELHVDNEKSRPPLRRQLALCGTELIPMDDLVAFLLDPGDYHQESLDLSEIDVQTGLLSIRVFDQHNIKASRKQIGPILQHFFATQSRN